MIRMTVDPARSSLRVETRAKGLLAKLAHDLSIDGAGPTGTCVIEEGRFALDLELPVAALKVAGVRKGGRVDGSVLSRSDVDDIQRRLRGEVLAGNASVTLHAKGAAPEGDRATVRAELVVSAGRGRQHLRADVTVRREGDRTIATGVATVSLDALDIAPVKAPLGAFRVDDAIEVHAHLELSTVPEG
jgi:hypothetical protein